MRLTVAFVLIVMLVACTSKVLTEDRAKAIISQAPQTGTYPIDVTALAGMMARSTNADPGNTEPGLTLHRLSDAKMASQKVDVVTYPRIDGNWRSERQTDSYDQYLSMQVAMVANTNMITGFCVYKWGNIRTFSGGGNSDVTGTVTPEGFVSFTSTCYSEGGAQRSYQYSESGKTAVLRSTESPERGAGKMGSPWVLTGEPFPRVEVKWYEYVFSPEVQLIPGNQGKRVAGGRYEVGEVSNLRLLTETQAAASFAWQAQLNKLGKILLDGSQPSGNGTAEFAKKPDGTWVISTLSF